MSLSGLSSFAEAAEQVSPVEVIPKISIVEKSAFVLKSDGRIWVYDYPNKDEGVGANEPHPFLVSASGEVVALEAGKEYVYALLDNGDVYRMDKNGIPERLNQWNSVSGISANGDTVLLIKDKKVFISDESGNNAKEISGINDISQVSLGEGNALLLDSQGNVFRIASEYGNWGIVESAIEKWNGVKQMSHGKLALGKNGNVWDVSGEKAVFMALSEIDSISSGKLFSLALSTNGKVLMLAESGSEIELEFEDKVIAVSAGDTFGAVLLENGKIEWIGSDEVSADVLLSGSIKKRLLKTSGDMDVDAQDDLSGSTTPSFMLLSAVASGNSVPFPSGLNPVIHLRSDEGVIADSGGRISEWRDVSGNNRHFSGSGNISTRNGYTGIKSANLVCGSSFTLNDHADVIVVSRKFAYGGSAELGVGNSSFGIKSYDNSFVMNWDMPWNCAASLNVWNTHAVHFSVDYKNYRQYKKFFFNGEEAFSQEESSSSSYGKSVYGFPLVGYDVDVFEVIILNQLDKSSKKLIDKYISQKYGIEMRETVKVATDLKCQSVDSTKARLSWKGTRGSVYTIERQEPSSYSGYEIVGTSDNLMFIDTNVRSGVQYYYRVVRDSIVHGSHASSGSYFYNPPCTDSSSILGYVHTVISIPTSAMAFWVKADAGVTTDANGRVTGLREQSKYGATLSRSSSGYMTLNSVAANGFPAFVLDGSQSYFSSGQNTLVQNRKDTEAFVVLKNSGGTALDIFNFRLGENKYPNAQGNIEEKFGRLNAYDAPVSMIVPRTTPLDDWRIYNVSVGGGTWQAYLDDILLHSESYTPDYNFNVGLVSFGCERTLGGGLKGSIAEMILFERKLTDSERLSVRNYLTGKYGVQKLDLTVPSSIESAGSTIKGKNYSGALGSVVGVGVDGVMLVERQGWLEYTFSVSQSGYYLFKVLATIVDNLPGNSPYDIEILVDGVSRERFTGQGKSLTLQSFMGLQSGTHTLRIKFSNPVHDRTFQVNSVSISSLFNEIEDTDWLALKNGILNPVSSSKVSPYCLEGKGDWSSVRIQGYGNEMPAMQQLKGKWYANVPLSPTGSTDVSVLFDGGLDTRTKSITWTPTNVYAERNQNIDVRLGDSLLFTAYKETVPQGKAITLTIDGQVFQTTDDKPVRYQFNQSGLATARLSTGESFSYGINVRDVYFVNPVSVVARGSEVLSGYGSSAYDASYRCFEGDLGITIREQASPPGLWIASELAGEQKILARLGRGGPIITVQTVNAATAYSAAHTMEVKTAAVYADGRKLIRIRFYAENLPEGAYFRVGANATLVFEDGSTDKRFYAKDFSEDGYLDVYMILTGSFCHTVYLYDKNGNILLFW